MDRGYTDFKRLYRIEQLGAFFVIRMHKQIRFKRVYSHPIDKKTGLICDQTILLDSDFGLKAYPSQVRRVRFSDQDTKNDLEFLTNNFELPALKKTLKLDESFYTLSQILSLSLFERTQNLSDFIKMNYKNENPEFDGAYILFDS